MATLHEITIRVKQAVGDDAGLGKTLKFDFDSDGCIHIDGGSVTNNDRPADLIITLSIITLVLISKGQLDTMTAVLSGRVKFSDLGLAMALQPKMKSLFSRIG